MADGGLATRRCTTGRDVRQEHEDEAWDERVDGAVKSVCLGRGVNHVLILRFTCANKVQMSPVVLALVPIVAPPPQ